MGKRNGAIAKIRMPRLHGIVERARLFDRIGQLQPGRAVWIAGPPGAGKTSLVASLVEARRPRALWYQVDGADADPSAFFYFLSLAAPGRRAPMPLLQPEYLPDLGGFAERFFRELFLRLPADALLVLDNYQELPADSPLNAALARAFAQIPPEAGVVVISRLAPPEAFAELQGRGGIAVLAWPELQLTLDETASICIGRDVTDRALVQALHTRSDGWAAGLTLMLERARTGGLSGAELMAETQDAVFDYFAGLLFRSASARDRSVLLRGALAPRLTAGILEALSGDAEAARLLESLYRRHLFTDRRRLPTRDREGTAARSHVYQFHALFRAFLLREARRAFPDDALRALSEQTAALLDGEGLVAEAVILYTEAHEFDRAAALVLREAPELLRQGRWMTVVEWARPLPDPVLDALPWLRFWLGKALVPIDPSAARHHLERAHERFVAADDTAGQLAAIAGIVWTHYFEAFATESMDRWIAPLERLLSGVTRFPSPAIELAAYSAFQLVTMFVKPSHPLLHPAALRLVDLLDENVDVNERVAAAAFLLQYFDLVGQFDLGARVIDKVDRLTGTPDLSPVGLVSWLTNRGYHFYITVRHGEAMETLDRAVAIARAHGLAQGEFSAHVFRGFAAAVEGEIPTGLDAIAAMERLLKPGWRVSLAQLHLASSMLEQQRGNAAIAADLAHRHLAAARTTSAPFFIIVWGSCAVGALAEAGQFDAARALLDEVRAAREGTCYTCYDGLLLLDEAYVDLLQQRHARARERLREGLAWARQRHLPHFFRWLVRGQSLLYAEAMQHDIESAYARSLVSAWRLRPPARDVAQWPWPLRIVTLGEFAVLRHDGPLKFGRKAPARLLELLKALIAMGARGVDHQRLITAVWPDSEGDAAQAVFTNALHRLRKWLGDDSLLDLRDGKLSLDLDRCWVDALAFESLCERLGGEGPAATDAAPDALLAFTAQIMTVYRGQFLPQDLDAPWTFQRRERLRSLFERHVNDAGARLERAGELDAAAGLYRRALELESLSEPFHRGLMRTLLAAGSVSEAMQAYRRCRDMLSIVLGVKPSQATQSLYERIQSAGPTAD